MQNEVNYQLRSCPRLRLKQRRVCMARYAAVMPEDVKHHLDGLLARARTAQWALPDGPRNEALEAMGAALLRHQETILEANTKDVKGEEARGTPDARIDRLRLSEARLQSMADACREVASLPDPLHVTRQGWIAQDGIEVSEVTVPFGVIGMVYESRPNVTVDAGILALKAGSAAVLRGSASALNSNRALANAMREGATEVGLPADVVQLIDDDDRAYVGALLSARGKVDLVLPRGGAGLIQHVVETAKVPVIETGVGNCHVYVHREADLNMAERIVMNAKVQRPGVCNAAETLLVDRDVAEPFLPGVVQALKEAGVEVRGCETTQRLVDVTPAGEDDWAEEFLDLVMAVRVVDSFEEAVAHIDRYGSRHSEAIVTASRDAGRAFHRQVDAAATYVNASTRYTDGFVFGFGAEMGISTQKLHVRGPVGLQHLVSTSYRIEGQGQIRER